MECMAQSQLPPKVPTMMQNWPSSSPFQMMPPPMAPTTTSSLASHQNSWVDEFLEFSSARRNAHRRSISDPIAFVETTTTTNPFSEQCVNNNKDDGDGGFERLDDEQLRKMFSDDVPEMGGGGDGQGMSSSGPSTPSDDQNSGNHDKLTPGPPPAPENKVMPKSEPEEVAVESDSSCKPVMETEAAEEEAVAANPLPAANNGSTDSFVDPKRIKRILANRQSAQRSRVRKLQYISELERSVTTLQTEVSTLSPRVAFLDHQRLILNVDNSVLKQRIAALAQDKIFKDAHQEALRKEIGRLSQIYHEQNMKKVAATTTTTNNEASQPQKGPTPNFTKNLMDQEN